MKSAQSSTKKEQELNLQKLLSCHLEKIRSRHFRSCRSLTDFDFIMTCLKRVITLNESGRDFLQFLQEVDDKNIPRSTFFEALKSPRRLAVLKDIESSYHFQLSRSLSDIGIDALDAFPELNDYEIFSGDGHFIGHPTHTKSSAKSGKVYPAGNVYILNMRNGLIQHFATVTDGSEKGHELPHFKNEIKNKNSGSKTIWVLDRAYIAHRYWEKQKKFGNLLISRTKSNSSITHCGYNSFDKDDPVNAGVVADYNGGFTNTQSTMRIIEYIDPETGEEMTFFTTLSRKILPGVICWLYFLRWRIEKSFDCFKNSLGEKKGWANGKNAIQIQGIATCMIYNFIHFLSEAVKFDQDCRDSKAEKKYLASLDKRAEKAKEHGRFIHPLILFTRTITRISSQFIRVVRNHFYSDKPLRLIIPIFVQRLETYL